MRLRYFITKVHYFLKKHNSEVLNNYLRKCGITVGENCNIYSDITTPESYLISIGNNVTISTDVQFITHDNSICKLDSQFTDVFGEIAIGNNVFIGARSLVLPGVTIGNDVIVGAGSVVTNSISSGKVVAGNPAKIIQNSFELRETILEKGFNIDNLNKEQKRQLLLGNKSKFIKKREI